MGNQWNLGNNGPHLHHPTTQSLLHKGLKCYIARSKSGEFISMVWGWEYAVAVMKELGAEEDWVDGIRRKCTDYIDTIGLSFKDFTPEFELLIPLHEWNQMDSWHES
jgi:hypothetical protein